MGSVRATLVGRYDKQNAKYFKMTLNLIFLILHLDLCPAVFTGTDTTCSAVAAQPRLLRLAQPCITASNASGYLEQHLEQIPRLSDIRLSLR